jgi:hypothetical protein
MSDQVVTASKERPNYERKLIAGLRGHLLDGTTLHNFNCIAKKIILPEIGVAFSMAGML